MKTPRPKHVPHDGGPYYFSPPWSTRAAPKAPSEVPWCTKVRLQYTDPFVKRGLHAAFKMVRCPTCGRRLQLMTVDIENGYGDFWPYIPPHKVRKLQARAPKVRAKKQYARSARGR